MRASFGCYSVVLLVAGISASASFAVEVAPRMSSEKRVKHIRVNREVTWSIIENLITLNELELAESVLDEHLKVDVMDGKSYLFKAQVMSRQGKKEEASRCIKRATKLIADSEPEMLLYAQSELAIAEGNREKGLEGFKKLAGGEGPLAEKARRSVDAIEVAEQKRANRKIASLSFLPGLIEPKSVQQLVRRPRTEEDRKDELESWSSNVNMSLLTGYDANILQIADSIVPFASNLGSMYSALGTQGVLSGGAFGGLLSLTGAGAYTRNFNPLAEGLNNINLSAGLSWMPKPVENSRFGWSIGLNSAATFMESASYNLFFLSTALSPTFAYRINSLMNAEVSVNYGINRYPGVELTSAKDNRAGSQYGGSAGIRGIFGDTGYSTGVSYSQQKTEGDNFDTNSVSANASINQPISFLNSTLSPGISYTKVRYPNSDTGRDDSMYSATLAWNVPLTVAGENFKTTTTLGWSHVDSKDLSATFTKSTMMLQVVYALK
jgi:tetratricopeptide (TPR) repeat protein